MYPRAICLCASRILHVGTSHSVLLRSVRRVSPLFSSCTSQFFFSLLLGYHSEAKGAPLLRPYHEDEF